MRQESHKKLYSYIYYCRKCKHLQLEVRVGYINYTRVSEFSTSCCVQVVLLLVSDKSFSWRVLISAHAACWLGGCINPPADQLITQHPCVPVLTRQLQRAIPRLLQNPDCENGSHAENAIPHLT